MSLREELDALSTAVCDISQGINALEAMTLGLSYAQHPYADGFNALSTYLVIADQEVRRHLTACINAI